MLDWDDLRFFLAVIRHGSLLGAAKDLRVAPSTVGRRLASLEASLGVRLLNRTPDGYVLTSAGNEVRGQAERVEVETMSLERHVGGRDSRVAGLVRVTCAETIASNLLAPCFAIFGSMFADVTLELIPDPRHLSLAMREADLSVRLSRPEQHDLVVKRIGSLGFGLYCSRNYLASYGMPDFLNGCDGHRLITQSDDIQDVTQTGWLAELTPRARTAIRTTSHEAAVSLTSHGGGLACLARFRADREDTLVRLDTPSPSPGAEIWLAVHRDNRDTPRIRAAMAHIHEWVRNMPAGVPSNVGNTLVVNSSVQ